ncbi:MAG: succinate dehydrogenase/fumarate reductase flavoprotein subunit [Candidatus Aminicenantes bacterium]|nr:MAG: succinate dehydrogenase/fumarate reductase flavoprotein subunit [Candidatus Aminicenantes bacterium]RLE03582.1 MAG: succinate dehydrogenase/fumarate reductase flavoprotein subunit [Candidatus Aminicenantes bacterium]
MYPEYMKPSLDKVAQTRAKRFELAKSGKPVFPPMSAEEREDVLQKFHPDYKPDARRKVRVGPNKGELLTAEVADLLESHSRIDPKKFDLSQPDYETDILIIGGGGGGCAAAIEAMRNGAKSIISTKLRLGDANSMMSQGGMQAADMPQDSPTRHYLDAMGGGHFDNKPELVRALTEDGPKIVKWLEELGVVWDKLPDGTMQVLHGGGTSRKRMHSCRDYTGAIIMRTLMDEVRNHPDMIEVLEFMPTVELLLDENGQCAGGILYNMETEEYFTVRAKATIIATGGFGRLHIRGFDTTNHYGATGDGLIMAYRAGANLLYMDSVQYHPTGAVYPEQIAGFLITEKIRGAGGQPVNKDGELFVFPREPRDVEAAAIIRECIGRKNGVTTQSGRVGIWLDSPLIEMLQGEGYIKKQFPAMFRQFNRYGIDITKEPMLIFPTLHYQNGGIEINDKAETSIPGLYVAGEASGGVHGRNRLMGNSVLDYNVFGRRAGFNAANYVQKVKLGKLTLEHVLKYEQELKEAGIETDRIAPVLLPLYTPEAVRKRQLTAHYEGTLR